MDCLGTARADDDLEFDNPRVAQKLVYVGNRKKGTILQPNQKLTEGCERGFLGRAYGTTRKWLHVFPCTVPATVVRLLGCADIAKRSAQVEI